jgi:hypothetical protein
MEVESTHWLFQTVEHGMRRHCPSTHVTSVLASQRSGVPSVHSLTIGTQLAPPPSPTSQRPPPAAQFISSSGNPYSMHVCSTSPTQCGLTAALHAGRPPAVGTHRALGAPPSTDCTAHVPPPGQREQSIDVSNPLEHPSRRGPSQLDPLPLHVLPVVHTEFDPLTRHCCPNAAQSRTVRAQSGVPVPHSTATLPSHESPLCCSQYSGPWLSVAQNW